MTTFSTLLIANRGEIAMRILRSARALGLQTIAIYSEADRDAPIVRAADHAVQIGAAAPRDSYLNIQRIINAAHRVGADAVHPGYGFLAENAEFAQACMQAGLVFVGPSPEAIRAMGNKALAKQRMRAAGIACIPGYDGEDQSITRLHEEAGRTGYPLMIKAAAGGGGRGMRLVDSEADFDIAVESARSEANNAFADQRLILERALRRPRHIEVQILADGHGNCLHLGERDCSIQRRHQKIIEESPSPVVDATLRARMGEAAITVARSIDYSGAGTVEFLYEPTTPDEFYFMEMNTRLQVEHAVTEAVTGLDLVELQLRIAQGERLDTLFPGMQKDVHFSGHAIEVRLCAEDPANDFLPATGTITVWQTPSGVRTDHALVDGSTVSPWYDSMLAKIVAHGPSRDVAVTRLARALDECVVIGVATNRHFLAQLVRHPQFTAGLTSTQFIADHFGTNALRAMTLDDEDWAIAAVLIASLPARPDSSIVADLRGWTSTSRSDRRVRLASCEQERCLRVLGTGGNQFEITVEDQADRAPIRMTLVSCAAHGFSVVEIDGVRTTAFSLRDDSGVIVQRGGRAATFHDRSLEPRPAQGAVLTDTRAVAPMNGRVVQVMVVLDAIVHRGDTLAVLEAMKMEHPVLARTPGRVVEVCVASGDQVVPGQLIVRLEPVVAVPPDTTTQS